VSHDMECAMPPRQSNPLSPAYYLMATALLSIIALMVIARRGPVGGRSPAGC